MHTTGNHIGQAVEDCDLKATMAEGHTPRSRTREWLVKLHAVTTDSNWGTVLKGQWDELLERI